MQILKYLFSLHVCICMYTYNNILVFCSLVGLWWESLSCLFFKSSIIPYFAVFIAPVVGRLFFLSHYLSSYMLVFLDKESYKKGNSPQMKSLVLRLCHQTDLMLDYNFNLSHKWFLLGKSNTILTK